MPLQESCQLHTLHIYYLPVKPYCCSLPRNMFTSVQSLDNELCGFSKIPIISGIKYAKLMLLHNSKLESKMLVLIQMFFGWSLISAHFTVSSHALFTRTADSSFSYSDMLPDYENKNFLQFSSLGELLSLSRK